MTLILPYHVFRGKLLLNYQEMSCTNTQFIMGLNGTKVPIKLTDAKIPVKVFKKKVKFWPNFHEHARLAFCFTFWLNI